jgi:hypothetical protein
MVWVLGTATGAWFVYGHRAISESEIERETERYAHRSGTGKG